MSEITCVRGDKEQELTPRSEYWCYDQYGTIFTGICV